MRQMVRCISLFFHHQLFLPTLRGHESPCYPLSPTIYSPALVMSLETFLEGFTVCFNFIELPDVFELSLELVISDAEVLKITLFLNDVIVKCDHAFLFQEFTKEHFDSLIVQTKSESLQSLFDFFIKTLKSSEEFQQVLKLFVLRMIHLLHAVNAVFSQELLHEDGRPTSNI